LESYWLATVAQINSEQKLSLFLFLAMAKRGMAIQVEFFKHNF
jgi:hypothetical protein